MLGLLPNTVRARVRPSAIAASSAVTIAVALGLSTLTAAPQASGAQSAAARQRKPDVIVIMTDDQRLGSQKGMPYLWDELRPEMTFYPNAQVPNNVCCPSRSSFLSGRYSHSTNVWDNTESRNDGGWKAFFKSGYERRTIARKLKQRGYKTVLLGKYMNQYWKFRNARKQQPPGWSDFRTYIKSNAGYWAPPHPVANIPRGYLTDTLGDAAVETIATTPADKPLFVMYAPYAPHSPSNAGPYKGAADAAGALERMREAGEWTNPAIGEPNRGDKPPFYRNLPRLKRDGGPGSPFPVVRNATRNQADTLMGVDANIRKIVEQQRAVRDWDNTMVIFMSDNGVAWGDHDLFDKTTPYRLTNGIPLLVKYPSWADGDAETDGRLINQLDVTATIADVTSTPMRTDGFSALQPAARSGLLLEAPTSKNSYEYWHPAYCGWRTKDALYVRYRTGFEELYDYTDDPYELDNKARDPGYAAEKATMLVQAMLSCDPAPPKYSRPRPKVSLRAITDRATGVTISPGVPSAQVDVRRFGRDKTWHSVGTCRFPGQIATSAAMTLQVRQKGWYRARMTRKASFADSAWTEPVLMSPGVARFTCR